ncbi:MAG: oxidoreductase domain protein [uncultured Nocardioidaceae bacterium]|uniref:Oxidoreductase domain protein n=1 Tax=uncultured Nocardioidaceae bacterium TaxID=253824 RepID=A0A6J4MHT6_9ACTN|nr:MAG: oxidoreductase domain protein [uncultured Nocardioidaceae bacterium]
MTAAGPRPLSRGTLGWGILATGGIAHAMARDLVLHGHRVAAVGSRSPDRARAFAAELGTARWHDSYEGLVTDPEVDVVYVATPHNLHAENALAAIEAGKHVLVEKAFTVNAREARSVVAAARSRGVVVLEAMWTRFLPHMAYVRSVVARGDIGELRSVHADHTQRLPSDPAHRLNDPALAGGALLDLGVYPLSFAHDLLGAPSEVSAQATRRDTGVEVSVATVLRHADDTVSTSYSSMATRGSNRATVLGTDGRIEIDAVWYAPTTVTVHDAADNVTGSFAEPVSGRGMQYQASEVERLVAEGRLESPLLTTGASIAVMETMDRVRELIGVRFPGE